MSTSSVEKDSWRIDGEASEPLYKRQFGMAKQECNELINLLKQYHNTYSEEEQELIIKTTGSIRDQLPDKTIQFNAEQGLLIVKFKKGTTQESEPRQGKDTKWQDEVARQPRARMHKPHKDEFASMEVRFLPEVRKLVDFVAASKGMAAAESVESTVVDYINEHPELVEQGEKRLKEFDGNLTRAKRQAKEEKIAHLESLVAKSSPRTR